MKKILLFSFFIISLISCEQKRISFDELEQIKGVCYEINSKTPYTGIAETYYDKGQLQSEETYVNGIGEGRVRGYYKNGQLQLKGKFKNGKLHGNIKKYYENGQLETEANFKNGKLHGNAKTYTEDGQLVNEKEFENVKIFE